MSILIKGMDKEQIEEIFKWARYGKNNSMIGMYAEIISVPPHGRLIDADALMKDGWKLFKQVGSSVHEMPLNNPSIPIIIEAEVDDV